MKPTSLKAKHHAESEKTTRNGRLVSQIAERVGNPMIWECRLRTAKDLEAEARRLEKVEARQRK